MYNLITFLFLIISSVFSKIQAQDVTGKWSGIMTVEKWWNDIAGYSHEKYEMTIQNNVVTGTMNGEGETILDGKLVGKHSCSGTGRGELWKLAFNADATYDLEIISHPYTCTGYNMLENEGQPFTTNNTEDLNVLSRPIPPNRNILSGSIDTSGEILGLGNFKKHISWTLINGPLDAVLIVTPVNYNNWTPKPSQNELLKGDAIAINLKVQGRNGGVASLKAVKFEISLNGTSTEPGTTINYPINSPYELPDLRLLPTINSENPDRGQTMEMDCKDGRTGLFFIGSYDGGGWSDLKVTAILQGGIQIEGHLLNSAGVTIIPIPKRKPGSHIADAWLQANGNPDELDDKEEIAGNTNKGDGLTAYEEYRGVWANMQHHRLNPKKKELGIFSKRNVAPYFVNGINLFKAASGVEVIRFTDGEIDSDRQLNKNKMTSHDYDQYVLKLDTGRTFKNAAGENRPTNLEYMLPFQSEEVIINITYMNEFYPLQAAAAREMNTTIPYTLNELIASTVAHEIAHGVNVNHHGDHSSNVIQERVIWEGQGNFHVFDNKPVPQEIPFSQWEFDRGLQRRYYKIFGNTGERTPGNEESGDMGCFMCYTSMYNWCFVTGSNGSLNYYMVPLLPLGKKLCTSRIATGINTKPWFFGPASKGNCVSQIKLRN